MARTLASTVDGYASFIASLAPITIALISENFKIDRLKYLESQTDSISVSLSSRLGNLGSDFFDVLSTLDLKITKHGEKKPLISFVATYELHFHASAVDKENVDKFIDSELRLVIWPYFRELVNNASGRMHVPPIILPVGGNQEK